MKILNFKTLSEQEIIEEYNLINARNVRKFTLERLEEVAEYYGNPASEKDVSDSFDEWVKECKLDTEDAPLLRESFANFVDSLGQEGLIHSLQVQSYEYVGKLNMEDS
ncbi:MAG: hypothetical protein AAFQ80_15080 [Cyanobacteria bacterium J06621_8]